MGNGEWRKMVARLRHLEEMHRDLKALKKKLEVLEKASDK
jgi:UDP-3-O-[3-hydroxymyristoyl] glucosamine N-acyltransferase